ncbi:hypothetical protein Tsubulata_040997 [Turnera subulata]|uniref:Uncharacterized protein n=1 Tax=Turnera subulata TaxID=218843 RepID=A0A9Q0FWX6_9ROSI|nr:hypothetical protein Tsubulata_040997 [Turnera subulata]
MFSLAVCYAAVTAVKDPKSFTLAMAWPPSFCSDVSNNNCQRPPPEMFTIHRYWPEYDGPRYDHHPNPIRISEWVRQPAVSQLSRYWPNLTNSNGGRSFDEGTIKAFPGSGLNPLIKCGTNRKEPNPGDRPVRGRSIHKIDTLTADTTSATTNPPFDASQQCPTSRTHHHHHLPPPSRSHAVLFVTDSDALQ